MNDILIRVYLSAVIACLAGLTIFILFQIIKTSQTKNRFFKCQKKLQKQSCSPQKYYQLGSLFLEKKIKA